MEGLFQEAGATGQQLLNRLDSRNTKFMQQMRSVICLNLNMSRKTLPAFDNSKNRL